MLVAPPLLAHPTSVTPDPLGLRVSELRLEGWRDVNLRVLRPFSWDAKHRSFALVDLPLSHSHERTLVMGPYAAADAAAWNVDAAHDVGFPDRDDQDGVLYRIAGKEPEAGDRFQDSAGWFTLAGLDARERPVVLAAAVDCSETLLVRVRSDGAGVWVALVRPRAIADPTAAAAMPSQPRLLTAIVPGGHSEGEATLRRALASVIPRVSRHEPPPLIVDTWGFGTAIDADLVAALADAAGELGAEIVTLDKGWERAVGDWIARDGYPGGVAGLAGRLSSREQRLGLWLALGNADPDARVAVEHPEWIAQWRGRAQTVSHRTRSLCLGHGAVQRHLVDVVDALVRDGLRWLLHDFETISRCDADHHDHEPGLGEAAAVDGWYRVLDELRRRHPKLRIENCWNGGRPLDLAMIARHDTTIGDDWCDIRHNTAAKIGLGRYLPASWCSTYMSDELELPDRAQFALYVVGGPWVVMGDVAAWSAERRATARGAIDIYRRWRPHFSSTHVIAPLLTASAEAGERRIVGSEVPAVELRDGSTRALVAVVIPDDCDLHDLRWHPPGTDHDLLITDEWTGRTRALTSDEIEHGIALPTSRADGLLLSVDRA